VLVMQYDNDDEEEEAKGRMPSVNNLLAILPFAIAVDDDDDAPFKLVMAALTANRTKLTLAALHVTPLLLSCHTSPPSVVVVTPCRNWVK